MRQLPQHFSRKEEQYGTNREPVSKRHRTNLLSFIYWFIHIHDENKRETRAEVPGHHHNADNSTEWLPRLKRRRLIY